MSNDDHELMSGGDFQTRLPADDVYPSKPGHTDFKFPVTILGRYEIQERIGSGGMGDVYLAFDQQLNRQVALKRIRPDISGSNQAVQRFYQEAKAAAALNHANIVQIYDRVEDEHGEYIVMEYVAGQSLAERLQQGAMDLDESARITLSLCDALQAAHDAGILHRDVKPANILLTPDGTPKLTDFGVARLGIDSEMTMAGATVGTLAYMAPEQERDAASASPQADQYALAATLYQMLTGDSPSRILERRIPDILRDVVIRATETEPTSRYGAMADFRRAILSSIGESVLGSVARENASGNAVETFLKQKERVEKIHEAARRLAFKQQDYPLARTTLQQIPESARDEALWREINAKAEQVESLNSSITQAVEQMEWKGLNLAVDALLELQPERTDLKQLREHIPDKEAITKENLFQSHNHELAQQVVKSHPGLNVLKQELKAFLDRKSLSDQINALLNTDMRDWRESMLLPLSKYLQNQTDKDNSYHAALSMYDTLVNACACEYYNRSLLHLWHKPYARMFISKNQFNYKKTGGDNVLQSINEDELLPPAHSKSAEYLCCFYKKFVRVELLFCFAVITLVLSPLIFFMPIVQREQKEAILSIIRSRIHYNYPISQDHDYYAVRDTGFKWWKDIHKEPPNI